ncbi:MAG: hypothetical protein R3D33_07985 [Hyphomicrobiaceae bacterium]
MTGIVKAPAPALALLAIASGILGTVAPGGDLRMGEAVLTMVLTGVWFGLVMGYGAWRFAGRSLVLASVALVLTVVGWEVAVNLAMRLERDWLKDAGLPEGSTMYASGLAAGAVGALLTWVGIAIAGGGARKVGTAVRAVATGAALGLLLPAIDWVDSPAILLVPWQVGVAAVLGHALGRSERQVVSQGLPDGGADGAPAVGGVER